MKQKKGTKKNENSDPKLQRIANKSRHEVISNRLQCHMLKN